MVKPLSLSGRHAEHLIVSGLTENKVHDQDLIPSDSVYARKFQDKYDRMRSRRLHQHSAALDGRLMRGQQAPAQSSHCGLQHREAQQCSLPEFYLPSPLTSTSLIGSRLSHAKYIQQRVVLMKHRLTLSDMQRSWACDWRDQVRIPKRFE